LTACYRPIIEGAGSVVTDWDGCSLTLVSGTRVAAAGSRALLEVALERIA
jgi:fructose-1,6-bisphosphatase/inositol monophosphatase family enzyme